MAKVLALQSAFNRGELDPALFGRVDWQTYFSGARLLRNMVCRTQGGVVKRAGTEFVALALEQGKPSAFIRFRFSVEQTYLLEFSDGRFRVFKDGGVLLYPEGDPRAGGEVIVASPYSAGDMARVRVAQTEDTMIFTHPAHRPRTLRRLGDHHLWEFSAMGFGAAVMPPDGAAIVKDGLDGAEYRVSAITAANEESLPSAVMRCGEAAGTPLPVPVYDGLSAEQCYYLWTTQYGLAWPEDWDIWKLPATGGGFFDPFARPSVLGYLVKTLGFAYGGVDVNNGEVRYNLYSPDTGGHAKISDYEFFALALAYTDKGFGGVLGAMRGRIREHVEAHNAAALPTGVTSLSWTPAEKAVRYRVYRKHNLDGAGVFYPVGETAGTSFTDDRLVALSAEQPQTANEVFRSDGNYPGVCLFYQQRLILARTDNQPNTVWGSRSGAYFNFNRSGLGEDDEGNPVGTVADTSAFEFTLQADEVNEILWGVSLSDILFGTAGGEFRMSGGGYIVTPTNVNAARQSNYGCSPVQPVVIGQAVLGVGRKGRVLRSYQFDYAGDAYRGRDVSHYAGHLFRRRSIAGIAHQYEPESVLWAVMSDGALLSCTYMDEEGVLGWARHDTDGRFEAVMSMVSIDGDDEIWFEVAREANGRTLRCIERMRTIQEEGDDVSDAWYVDCGLGRDGEPARVLGGLGHLEGRSVVCLGDGNVYAGLVVSGGSVTLPVAVRKAVVGLPYGAEVGTMELEPPDGSFVGASAKRPATASVLFYHSRECLYGDPDNPNEMKFRSDEKLGRAIVPRTVRKTVSWPAPRSGSGASLWLASPSPVPFGVLSVAVTLSVGEAAPGRAGP